MKKNSPEKTLSIIIPNFNKGKFISKTLDSILLQSVLPNEIIIIDDCSTDNSVEIIKYYETKYPNLFVCKYLCKNKGVQYCRNLGIEISKSEYICFVDSDDIYLVNNCIELQMQKAKPKRLVGVYQLTIDDQNNITSVPESQKKKVKYWKHPQFYLYLMNNFMLWPWHYIVAKDAVRKVNCFDNPFSLYEDSEMLIKLSVNGTKIKWINIEGKGYRVNQNDPSHLSNASVERIREAKEYIWAKYKTKLSTYSKLRLLLTKIKRKLKQ